MENILYTKYINAKSVEYGKTNESVAIDASKTPTGKQIVSSGLFIDNKYSFLAATPDDLIEERGIVNIKCPWSAANCTPEEAIASKYITFWKKMN